MKYTFDCLKAREGHDVTELISKVTFAHKHGENGEKCGLSLMEFAEQVAMREARAQLSDLLIYRKALEGVGEQMPMVGTVYPREVVQWIFAASEYNYLQQFFQADIISPMGDIVHIDWAAVVETIQECTVCEDIVYSLLF